MRRRILIAAGVALCAIVGIVLYSRQRPQPNLLIITLDTTRADRLGCYGYAAAHTPALDALAAGGVVCEQAYTVAPLTLPAHTSLFTGLFPQETGIRTNCRGRLDDSIPTLAQQLAKNGYDTGAFVAAFVLDRKFGLDQGFKTYDDEFAGASPNAVLFERRRSGDTVVDAALAWLGQKRAGPFFCWVHLFDPHLPYLHGDSSDDRSKPAAYDTEIAFADRQVGRLLEFLKSQNIEKETLVVVVGDHGESFREHGEPTHGLTLYNATLRVPLIFRKPGELPSGRRVQSNVSLVDVYPTIFEQLGIRPPRTGSGRSLRQALSGGETGDSLCYAATDDPFLQYGWSPLRTLVDGHWKFVQTPRPELYDLANDPGELHNLIDANPAQKQKMERQLTDFESKLTSRTPQDVQLSPSERRALLDFGYISAGTPHKPAASGVAILPDVKDMLALNDLVEEAQALANRGWIEMAARRLQEVVHRSPAHARAAIVLADLLIQKSELDEAATVLLNLLDANPDAQGAHSGLGNILAAQRQFDEAAAEFQRELDIAPLWIEAHYQLARLALLKEDRERALRHFEAMLEIDGTSTLAYKERADLYFGMRQIPAAIADYRKVLQFNPRDAEAEYRLGILLTDRDADESRRHFEHAVALVPDQVDYRFALGTLLMQQHEYARAVEQLTRALELKPDSPSVAERLRRAQEALRQARQSP